MLYLHAWFLIDYISYSSSCIDWDLVGKQKKKTKKTHTYRNTESSTLSTSKSKILPILLQQLSISLNIFIFLHLFLSVYKSKHPLFKQKKKKKKKRKKKRNCSSFRHQTIRKNTNLYFQCLQAVFLNIFFFCVNRYFSTIQPERSLYTNSLHPTAFVRMQHFRLISFAYHILTKAMAK